MKRAVAGVGGGIYMCRKASSNVSKCGTHTNNSTSYFDFLLMSCLFFIILCGWSFRCCLEK